LKNTSFFSGRERFKSPRRLIVVVEDPILKLEIKIYRENGGTLYFLIKLTLDQGSQTQSDSWAA